jgi:Xaa-Pro aminopeptidase
MSDFSRPTPKRCAARREILLRHLDGQPALIPAGDAVGRNYPGNPYPFRASSHFLYLVGDAGQSLPGTWLLLDGDKATLFAHAPTAEDALWHGPSPSLAELGEHLGLAVRDIGELEDALKGKDLASVPAPDAITLARQQTLLGGRAPGEHDARDARLIDGLIAQRLVHDADAIAGLKEAAEGTVAAHLAGMAATRPGRHEYEIKAVMEEALAQRHMGTSYNPIVTTHGEVLHNNDYPHRCEAGDLILADVGAETPGGWAGDVTRTWPVSGAFSGPQKDLYQAVLNSQLAAIAAARPGARYRDVHLVACTELTRGLVDLGILEGDPEELVADDVHALFYPHGTGHLIGLDVHDMEDLGDRAGYAPGRERSERFGLCYLRLDRDLQPGMAVTIEPGFYQVPAILEDEQYTARARGRLNTARLAAFGDVRGIRIEDDVLITDDGQTVLTAAIPKTIDAVEDAVNKA